MCFLILKKFRLSNELTIIPSRDAILHQNCIILPEVYQDLLTCTPKLYRHSKNKVVTSSKTFHKLYIIRIFAFCSLKTCLQLFQILVCVFHCKNKSYSYLMCFNVIKVNDLPLFSEILVSKKNADRFLYTKVYRVRITKNRLITYFSFTFLLFKVIEN